MKSLITTTIKPLYDFINSKSQREFIRLIDKWGKVERFSPRTINFLSYKFEVPDCLSFVWQFKEIFVDEVYRFETKSNQPVIYDCGANIGTSCLYFKELYPDAKIKAFEADPHIAGVLKSNLLENGITDVEIINKAVWVDNDGVEFCQEGADAGSIYDSGEKIRIDSISLKEVLAEETTVDMLKIDIEGAEVDLLLDCEKELQKVDNLFVEYHSFINQPQRLNEVFQVMTKSNFRYFVKPVVDRDVPFINKGLGLTMDLQLNIFAYRV